MSGALDFLDTLVNRAADVAVARGNADVATARVTDQTRVPYTSTMQIAGRSLSEYLPLIVGGLIVVAAAYFILKRA